MWERYIIAYPRPPACTSCSPPAPRTNRCINGTTFFLFNSFLILSKSFFRVLISSRRVLSTLSHSSRVWRAEARISRSEVRACVKVVLSVSTSCMRDVSEDTACARSLLRDSISCLSDGPAQDFATSVLWSYLACSRDALSVLISFCNDDSFDTACDEEFWSVELPRRHGLIAWLFSEGVRSSAISSISRDWTDIASWRSD